MSHVLVRVDDVAGAVGAAGDAGFSVGWGSDPADAHNALIHFHDGPFIELFDPVPSGRLGRILGPPVGALSRVLRRGDVGRFAGWVSARGPCDWALEIETALADEVESLEADGIEIGRVREVDRTPPDRPTSTWSVVAPKDPSLPFVMDPYDPPLLIDDGLRSHPCGVERITAIELTDPEPTEHARVLGRYLDASVESVDGGGWSIDDGRCAVIVRHGAEHGIVGLRIAGPSTPLSPLFGLPLLPALG